MTDKQIIIDVSDCSELCGTKCHILMSCTNTSKSDSCSEMPNCYYKQLKRKEQECEELKAKCKKYGEINEQETKDYAELKAENDKLKTTLTEIKEIIFPKNQLIITDSPIILKIQEKISECEV